MRSEREAGGVRERVRGSFPRDLLGEEARGCATGRAIIGAGAT
ncbi:MAG: hypothetical protein ACE5GW_00865 [Planctomycetota bacterium]